MDVIFTDIGIGWRVLLSLETLMPLAS